MSLSIKIKPLILVGSEGSGRSAISFHLIRKFPHKFQRVISHTTRKPRQQQKQHYYFVQNNFVTDNMQKFVTLTKSANGHFYGLIGEQVMRVIDQNKIPIFKMTLQAYNNNVSRQKNIEIKQEEKPSTINKMASLIFKSKPPQFLSRNKLIQTNALYITVPDIKELQRRLKCSPHEQKDRQSRIERARKQQQQFSKCFQQEDIIRSEEDMDKTIKNLQSRLFQLY